MPRVALLSTSDTDLLSGRSSRAEYALANPSRLDVATELPALLDGADLVIVRILGTARSWQDGLDAVRAVGVPMIVLGGEQTPDAELMRLSTVPIGVAAQAHQYLAEGGPANLGQLHAFVCDTVLLTGEGFDPPTRLPAWGLLDRPAVDRSADAPKIGILYYRAHQASGNTAFVHALADAVQAQHGAVAVPIFCSSLRGAPADLLAQLGALDALIVTVLAAGGTKPATATAGGDDEAWDVTALAALDIPILQGLCLTWSRGAVGRLERGPHAAGRGHPGGGPGVRRPDHHGAVLLQGDRLLMGCPFTSRMPNAAPGWPASPWRTPGSGTSRPRSARSRSCCRRTRPSTPGSAMRSAWTRRCRPSGCSGRCARPATTSGLPAVTVPCPGWPRWSRSPARNRTPPPATR